MAKLTHERLQELLSYDPATGVFAWLKPTSPRVSVGSRAGVVATNGRRYIALDGEKFMAHRLAWFYLHGEWPEGDVKQKNEDFDDCRADNLEDVSRSVASRSRALDNRNKSGFRGVSQTRSGRWTAFITREYKQFSLGVFDTAEEASAAYEQAAAELESVSTPEMKAAEAEKAAIRRRLRMAWKRLPADHEFASYEEFVSAVGDVPARHTVAGRNGPASAASFEIVADLSTGFDLSTQEGRIAYNRAHRKANPDEYKNRQLRKDFGISLDDYNQMLAAQNGVCAICFRPERASRDGEILGLALDHDHNKDPKDRSGHRGLLCGNCNKGIGKFEDTIEYLEAAIAYLLRYEGRKPFVCDDPTRDWLHVASPGTLN